MTNIREIMTAKVQGLIDFELEINKSPIFVFVGVDSYIDIDAFVSNIVDMDTFTKNGNEQVFDDNWFDNVYYTLRKSERAYHILSLAQFSYLNYYRNIDVFAERIIIVRDTLRMLLPISKEDFLAYNNGLIVEEKRPENLPDYMADQVRIGSDFFYSINLPLENFATVRLFDERKPLQKLTSDNDYSIIDVINDPHGLDIFINKCLTDQSFEKKVLVKVHEKYPQDKNVQMILEELNGLLQMFGGELFELVDSPIEDRFIPSANIISLLKQYWGENADFRNLRVYKNPDYEKTVVSISQGLIVETIINEYKNAKAGKTAKDLFLTAPTGAGKSLLFQLPAFYVSKNQDVTIVVSPLIALMKDQVNQIWSERGFKRAQYINGELSLIDRDRVIEECKKGEIDILYMAPELLLSYDLSFFIGERKLGLLVIDEAHLITTWGRDFRVDYWFLGQHINKIRKYCDYSFPMVAVTATAIYGGDNDMVFDSINSLNMNDPHVYIGEVTRNDITFLIDNHDRYKHNYDAEKEKETVEFIKNIHNLDIKTIVYTPYTRQIDKLQQRLEADKCGGIAVSYHGNLTAEAKDYAYKRFRSNDAKIMISTKAFGMGVDIADIQLVYHHAPSGLLPDYIQEIGRAARKANIKGFAALSYAAEDQRYSKILHGMSSLKMYQLREVLKKVYKVFVSNGKKRNMLLSVNDFSYIFDNGVDLDQKVMTALMMIEKDYLAKFRFNVLIARPKKLFVKVYARTNLVGYNHLQKKYPNFFKVISSKGDYYTLLLNLDEIWQSNFSDQSFPKIKHDFYKGLLFNDDQIGLTPLMRVTFTLEKEYKLVQDNLNQLFSGLKASFVHLQGHFFSEDDLNDVLKVSIKDDMRRKKIVKFVLATYSDRSEEEDAFLQRRRGINHQNEYRIMNVQYNKNFAALQKHFSKMFSQTGKTEVDRYASVKSIQLTNYIRLGSLLEIMELATYESCGGDNPMLFVRINDPLRVQRDADNTNYTNSLLSKTHHRHKNSCELFDHFFLHTFENEQRWNFIEDYFLGASNDELLDAYPGGGPNHIDIIKYLENNAQKLEAISDVLLLSDDQLAIYLPREGEYYDCNRLLTIDNQTMKVGKWIVENPVALDKVIRKYKIYLQDQYDVLKSRLIHNHFEYYRDIMGLKLWIDFPGYDQHVAASVPYSDQPIKFYKWWKTRETQVTMSLKEKLQLFLKVEELSPGTLVKRHREMLNSKRK